MRRVGGTLVGLALFAAGCASAAFQVPRDPVWAFEASYPSGFRQILYTNEGSGAGLFGCEGMKGQVTRQAPQPSVTPCRLARVFDMQGARDLGFKVEASPHTYWALVQTAKNGLAVSTQENCRQVERLTGPSAVGCVPILILFADTPPAAEATK